MLAVGFLKVLQCSRYQLILIRFMVLFKVTSGFKLSINIMDSFIYPQ